MRVVGTVVLLGTMGCDSEGLSRREAHHAFDAVNTVANSVGSSAQRAVTGGTAGDFTVDVTQGGFAIHGEVTDGVTWTGTVVLDGDVVTDGGYGYAFTLGLQDVTTEDGAVFNGEVTLSFLLTDLDLDLELGLAIDLGGELVLTGEDSGVAELDYHIDILLDGLALSTTASGNISDYDVTPWETSAIGWLL